MDIQTNVSLQQHTTMRLGGAARFFVDVHSTDQLQHLYGNAMDKNIPVYVLGGGSNIIVHDEGFNGLIMHMRILGFTVVADDPLSTTITIGAGEIWDDIVKRTTDMGLTGIETLSAIPGTTGATPIQNVGAYGQEIADTLVHVEAFDTQTNTFVHMTNQECEFSYRQSIFNTRASGRYIITTVTLKLLKNSPAPPFYDSLQSYLTAHGITQYTPAVLRDAVIAIRAEKLPNPQVLANTGSFFKNAIVEKWLAQEIQAQYPDLKAYDMGNDTVKIPAGWLIEKAGLKGALHHGMRVYDKNALVLVNESATGYADLAAARDEIIGTVRDTFRIMLRQEPLELQPVEKD